jgi:hypothetical protein
MKANLWERNMLANHMPFRFQPVQIVLDLLVHDEQTQDDLKN